MALSTRQELFCLEYIKDGNGTQAAIRAGYAEKAAKQTASRLLTYENVRARVEELMQGLEKDKIADATEVMEFLTACMRGEVEEEVVTSDEIGTPQIIKKKVGVREQVKAGELMAKRYGLLSENVKLSGNVPVQIIDDLGSGDDGS